jgi:anthranilate phosphoribosyltransferase
LAILDQGKIEQTTLNPQEVGLTLAPLTALKGGDVEENVEILRNLLQEKAHKHNKMLSR